MSRNTCHYTPLLYTLFYSFHRMKAQEKTWVATRHQGIYRHKSGVYYLRISSGRKKSWRSLGTSLISVARPKAEQLLRELRQTTELAPSDAIPPEITMGELAVKRLKEIENDPSLKPATRHYWKQVFTALLRSWPELETLKAKSIGKLECENWAGTYSKCVSGTRFNNTLAALKKLFSVAVESGVRITNPAIHLKRVKPSQKDLTASLPSRDQFAELVTTIRSAGGDFPKRPRLLWNCSLTPVSEREKLGGYAGRTATLERARLLSEAIHLSVPRTDKSDVYL